MRRLRITMKIDTDMTREQFNRHVNSTARVLANTLGELVYLATDWVEPPSIMHDTKENPVKS